MNHDIRRIMEALVDACVDVPEILEEEDFYGLAEEMRTAVKAAEDALAKEPAP